MEKLDGLMVGGGGRWGLCLLLQAALHTLIIRAPCFFSDGGVPDFFL